MNDQNREKGIQLLKDFYYSVKAGHATGPAVGDALVTTKVCVKELKATGSYKSYDYAVARFMGRVGRLIGYKDLVLDPEARAAWRAIKTYTFEDIAEDLRQVGGPALG